MDVSASITEILNSNRESITDLELVVREMTGLGFDHWPITKRACRFYFEDPKTGDLLMASANGKSRIQFTCRAALKALELRRLTHPAS